ncbi:MAG TPA: hypothetical protein VF331_20015 [Polyangiales bacterium]
MDGKPGTRVHLCTALAIVGGNFFDHFFDHFGVHMRDRACASVMVNSLK